jgi:hypothetical protein
MEPQDWKGWCLHSMPIPRLSTSSDGGRRAGDAYVHNQGGEWSEVWGGLSSSHSSKIFSLEDRRANLHGKLMEKPISTMEQLKLKEKEDWKEWKKEGLVYLKKSFNALDEEHIAYINRARQQFQQWMELPEEEMTEFNDLIEGLGWRPYTNPWDENESEVNEETNNEMKHKNMTHWLAGWQKLEVGKTGAERPRKELIGYLKDDKRSEDQTTRTPMIYI